MHAGQAVVQFVRAPKTNAQFAIKFFLSRAAYTAERRLFAIDDLREFMPPVVEFVDNEDGAFMDPFGNAMPPCFVMEKGEALPERTARCNHDFFTTIQVCPAPRCVLRRQPSVSLTENPPQCHVHAPRGGRTRRVSRCAATGGERHAVGWINRSAIDSREHPAGVSPLPNAWRRRRMCEQQTQQENTCARVSGSTGRPSAQTELSFSRQRAP